MTESVQYTVLRTLGRVEMRNYPSMVLVSVQGLSDNEAFGILFDYISGNNLTRRRIPMTAPVISAESPGEKIPMTAPVISGGGFFAFVLPTDYTAETAPKPNDTRAKLVSVPQRKLAVIRFRGRTTASDLKSRTEELLSAMAEVGTKHIGEPFLMRYNPPFMPGFLRRNEIAIELE